jgi:tRNA-dihydrouridine synthase 1
MKATVKEQYDPPNINRMQTDDSDEYVPRGPARFPPQFDMEQHVADAWRHWEQLGSPRWVMAPMGKHPRVSSGCVRGSAFASACAVPRRFCCSARGAAPAADQRGGGRLIVDQSELAFRAMGRKYGCGLAYTPMLHSKIFAETPRYRKDHFQTNNADRPLVVQFCANNPGTLLKAARFVEDQCDAVDLNLGCPQDIARRGKYGSFLMEDWDRVHDMILTLKQNLNVPVWAKIRIYPDLDRTKAYAKMIEAAGASIICIHGRTREQKGNDPGPADLDAIRQVAASLRVPVIANGNVATLQDAEHVLEATRCQAVMSAVGLLQQPALFSGARPEPLDMAREYLHFADRYNAHLRMVRPHIFQMLYAYLRHRPDLLAALSKTQGLPEQGAVASFSPFLDRVAADVGTLAQAEAQQENMGLRPQGMAWGLGARRSDDSGSTLSNDDPLVPLSIDGRRLKKSEYKALLRKKRTMQRRRLPFETQAVELDGEDLSEAVGSSSSSPGGLASLFGDGAFDPFEDASRFYHRLPADDTYGEKSLAALAQGARARAAEAPCAGYFLVRRSNSDPFAAVSLTFITNPHTNLSSHTAQADYDYVSGSIRHCKISYDQDQACWRMPASWAGLTGNGGEGGEEGQREAQSLDALLQALFQRHGFVGLSA